MRHGTKKQRCDWKGCQEEGIHRAPRSAEALEDYRWFCLEHIRQYNAQWDYFKGRSQAELDAFRDDSLIGHRPTWPMGHKTMGPDWSLEDTLDILKARPGVRNPFESAATAARRTKTTPTERRALAKLGLDETASVAEIKKRYKSLVKQYHPDAAGTPGSPGSEDRLKQIIQAYSDLKACGRLTDAVA